MFSRLTHIWDKNPGRKYPAIQDMLTIYFSNEHDDFGNSINEIIGSYRDYSISSIENAKLEISSLLETEDEEVLTSIMEKIANDRFHPEPWGETWRSFLEKTLFLLKH